MKANRIVTGAALAVLVLAGAGCATLPWSQAKPFTLVVLPDTQNYADADAMARGADLRETFHGQTAWIKDNRKDLNVVMVAHAGDIVQTDHPKEWAIADAAFKTIDDEVPYILCLGNHDIGRGEAGEVSETLRRTNLNTWFPPSRFRERSVYQYGGCLGASSENYYVLFEGGGMEFLIMALEFKPRDVVLEWANGVVATHPDRRCIVVTHAYLDDEASLYDGSGYDHEGNDGRGMWDRFVKRHENVFLVLCGHVLGEALRTTQGDHGNDVYQVLADYQGMANGGDGFLRIMTFVPKEDTIQVRTYSPTRDHELTRESSAFSLPYRMRDRQRGAR